MLYSKLSIPLAMMAMAHPDVAMAEKEMPGGGGGGAGCDPKIASTDPERADMFGKFARGFRTPSDPHGFSIDEHDVRSLAQQMGLVHRDPSVETVENIVREKPLKCEDFFGLREEELESFRKMLAASHHTDHGEATDEGLMAQVNVKIMVEENEARVDATGRAVRDITGQLVLRPCPYFRIINGYCNNVGTWTTRQWGSAGETMPRCDSTSCDVAQAQSTTGAGSANVYDGNRWTNYGGATWGGFDPRDMSNAACKLADDTINDGGAYVPSDCSRGDSVITFAQVLDHELDATGPKDYFEEDDVTPTGDGTATDSGTEYKFGSQNPNSSSTTGVGGKFKRTNDIAKNGITSYVDAGIVYGETQKERNLLRNGDFLIYSCLENATGLLTDTCDIQAQYLPITSQVCTGSNAALGGKVCNDDHFFMANPTRRACFYAGDFRANENPALLAYHTLFARMHNSICSGGLNETQQTTCDCDGSPPYGQDKESTCMFETCRHAVGHQEAYITYEEWLPAYTGNWNGGSYDINATDVNVLDHFSSGVGGMPAYTAYDSNIRGSVRHVFAAATYRQHTGVNHTMQLESGGNLELDQTYFESCIWAGNTGPGCTTQTLWSEDPANAPAPSSAGSAGNPDSDETEHGVKNLCDILAGQTSQASRRGDTIMVTEERNQLFYKAGEFVKDGQYDPHYGNKSNQEGGSGGFEGFGGDLAALNMFRGRDHNIAGYRQAFDNYFSSTQGPTSPDAIHVYHGLPGTGAYGSADLSNAYGTNMDAVDLWTGALGEAKLINPGGGTSMLGALLTWDVVTQFRDLRDGDRFYFENPIATDPVTGYGAPVVCNYTGGAEGKGLAFWVDTLTGASSTFYSSYAQTGSGNSNPFQTGTVTCNHDGETQDHSAELFSDDGRCGSLPADAYNVFNG